MPEEEGSKILDVAVALIERDGRYLISQRLPEDSFGGFWEFPGGKCRPGEMLEECFVREIQEELDVLISVGAIFQTVEHQYPHRTIRLHFFSCRILKGEPQTIECTAWRWVLPQEMFQYQFPPASAPIIEALMKRGNYDLQKKETTP